MTISIIFATCGREELYRKALESLFDTVSRWDVELVSVIDESYTNCDTTMFVADKRRFVLDFFNIKRGALWAWNRGLQISTGELVVMAGDDQIFHPNWLDYALESHERRLGGYGVVGMNDLAYDGNIQLATMFLFDRLYCKEIMGGIFAPPVYNYYCVDSEWNEKAKLLGRYTWDERAKVEHIHSAHGKRGIDELDREKMDAGWMEADNMTFEMRKILQFPVVWDSLI